MTIEELSPHEKLARKLEQWEKGYYDDVRPNFMERDMLPLWLWFDQWENKFLIFLTNEAPSLVSIYKKNVQELEKKDETFEAWQSRKGKAIESFLGLAIREARAKKIIPESGKIFIGHGRSPMWRELKDFLQDRLHLKWDEFNREPTAGYTTVARLEKMLDEASFAFLVMTAEDEHSDMKLHARQNVIHEVGLFQGKLGFKKAIILLEEGCEKFSNIEGLTYISFPKGNIEAAFERIRGVLEREGIVK
jgi:predicted nucleotide-binding protein